jgi:uncharacterized membrane protein YozB (DUF420 family)
MIVISVPAINAILNGSSALLIAIGYWQIRQKNRGAHRACMLAAFVTSTIFLISYLAYHARHGSTHFTGQGWIRPVYFTILGTHTFLAAAVVPLVIFTLYRARREQFARHKKIARWTLPIWFYVSITGVIIYLLLYQLYPARI